MTVPSIKVNTPACERVRNFTISRTREIIGSIPFSTANYDGRWESQLEIFFLTEYNILARRVTRFARRILSQRILPPRPSLFLPSLARRKCNCNLHARRFNDSAGYTRELQFSSPTVFVPVEMTAVSVITDFLTS